MNAAVKKLFHRLQHGEDAVQNIAIAQLAMLLEQSTYLDRKDDTWELVLPEDLLGVRLSRQQIKEVLSEAVSLMALGRFAHGTKLALAGVITRNLSPDNADFVLKFFSDFAPGFSDQDTFSFLVEFDLFLRKVKDLESIRPLVERYGTIQLLERFELAPERGLRESAGRLRRCLQRA